MTEIRKSDEFYRPDSRPLSKRRRTRISVIERGYRQAVLASGLPIESRIKVLEHLVERFDVPRGFLSRLVRKVDIPAKVRLRATQLLEARQMNEAGLYEAQKDAQAVLDGIRSRRAAAEPRESVFGGLDEKS